MDNRKFACGLAAGFITVTLLGAATSSSAKPPEKDVVVAQKIDPELQRRVSYADLNLALRPAQKVLGRRIAITARDLCFDINGASDWECTSYAVGSTKTQVAEAIDRAERKMAGLPVGPAIAISMAISAD